MCKVRTHRKSHIWRWTFALIVALSSAPAHAGWESLSLIELGFRGLGEYKGIWGNGSRNVYFAGNNINGDRAILRYDGKKWLKEKAALPPFTSFLSIWGSGPNDIYAVGQFGHMNTEKRGALVMHYDGRQWKNLMPEIIPLFPAGYYGDIFSHVWGSSPDHVFIAGNIGPIGAGSGSIILRFDGKKWSVSHMEESLHINDLAGSGPQDVYAVGQKTILISERKGGAGHSIALRFDGTKWNPVESLGDAGMGSDYSSITFVSRGDIFIKLNMPDPENKTRRTGRLLRGDGSKWSPVDTTPMEGVRRIFAVSSHLYALGVAPKIVEPENIRGVHSVLLFHFEGGTWRWIPLNSEMEPEHVWGADNHLFVTGPGRAPIFHHDGQGNIEEPVLRPEDRNPDPKDKLDF